MFSWSCITAARCSSVRGPGRIGGGSPEDVRIDQGLGMVSERAERAVVDPESLEHDVGVVGGEDVGGG
jgi:hypothetical protein